MAIFTRQAHPAAIAESPDKGFLAHCRRVANAFAGARTARLRRSTEQRDAAALVNGQLSPWRGARIASAFGRGVVSELNQTSKHLFVLRIERQAVRVMEKTRFFSAAETAGDQPTSDRHLQRVLLYRNFIRNALEGSGFQGTTTLVVSARDLTDPERRVPVLAFQKPLGSSLLLLPDIDLLVNGFYEGAAFVDRCSYNSKEDGAIFVGATTGLPRITLEDVHELRLPRLRSAVYFQQYGHIHFHLPHVVQADSDETAAAIRELDVGSRPYTWQEMLQFKILLSMDGNGANCSRIAVGLKSNSVLMKYQSPYELYYFSAMRPWVHYIPATSDQHVTNLVEWCFRRPDMARAVAAAGREFAHLYLSKAAVLAYTRALVEEYATTFETSETWS